MAVISIMMFRHLQERGIEIQRQNLLGQIRETREAIEKTAKTGNFPAMYKQWFRDDMLAIGMAEKDISIMGEVIGCESTWRQFYDETGEVIVVNSNIGLGQINITAHEDTWKAMGLDVYKPKDNLKFTAYLYKRDGLKPWIQWSGPCFIPKIQKYLDDKTSH